ncbi:MAG: NUDIX domain-containing protein [Bacteroidales bacterium]|nr:NUDIX domain-containing protein [Bacteroidales bacterium]MDD4655919.1 NUDIX domain-containing protein [Bacteroidales bacterium]
MEETFCYQYPRPAVTTDCVVFGFDGQEINVLLVERGSEPFKGKFALPGGFLEPNETLEECAQRELLEETGIDSINLRQFAVFSDLERDPRTRVISVMFYGLLAPKAMESDSIKSGSDAVSLKWLKLEHAMNNTSLAFDHKEAIVKAKEALALSLNREPVAFELLDQTFTIKQLQIIYETLLNIEFDRANFHKKMVGHPSATLKAKPTGRKKNSGVITDTGTVMKNTKHKPAKFYTFDSEKYSKLMEQKDFYFGF